MIIFHNKNSLKNFTLSVCFRVFYFNYCVVYIASNINLTVDFFYKLTTDLSNFFFAIINVGNSSTSIHASLYLRIMKFSKTYNQLFENNTTKTNILYNFFNVNLRWNTISPNEFEIFIYSSCNCNLMCRKLLTIKNADFVFLLFMYVYFFFFFCIYVCF